MTERTEQEVAALLLRYAPEWWNGSWEWMRGREDPRWSWRPPADVFDLLEDGTRDGFHTVVASYETREAAYADLAQALRYAEE